MPPSHPPHAPACSPYVCRLAGVELFRLEVRSPPEAWATASSVLLLMQQLLLLLLPAQCYC